MDWLYWLVLAAFWILLLYYLYIPLPSDIADRPLLTITEFILRLVNEYLGDIVEIVGGPHARNQLLRYVMAAVFGITRLRPKYVKVSWEKFNGVPVRAYVPVKKESSAALVFIHGGGWATMKAEYYDDVMYAFIRRYKSCVFSIDYRLSPEHPFPAAVEDCEAATRALITDRYKEFGVDPKKVIIIGDSAGGNLSAVTTLRLKQRPALHPLAAQVLIYPVIHMFGFRSASYSQYYVNYNGSAMLNPASMARWCLFYLGAKGSREEVQAVLENRHLNSKLLKNEVFSSLCKEILDSEDIESLDEKADKELCQLFLLNATNKDVCPVLADSLQDLPPALVMTAGYDILRDEAILYGNRLKREGVPTEMKHYPTGYHGVFNMPFSRVRKQMMRDIAEFVQPYL